MSQFHRILTSLSIQLLFPIPLVLLQIRGIRAQRASHLVNAYVFLATDIVIGVWLSIPEFDGANVWNNS